VLDTLPHHESGNGRRPASRVGYRLVFLALLASAWGLSELIGGETIWLTARALLLLAVARALLNRPGTSTVMAAIAMLFKSVNTAPFLCHLAGIALLGIAFDLMASLLWRDDRRTLLRAAATGASSAYLSCLLFAVAMVWVVRFEHWVGGGLDRVVEYTLTSGSGGALTALVVVPLGLWLGSLLERRVALRPLVAVRGAAAACLALWVLGPFVG
jgi:hypothetical protein